MMVWVMLWPSHFLKQNKFYKKTFTAMSVCVCVCVCVCVRVRVRVCVFSVNGLSNTNQCGIMCIVIRISRYLTATDALR